MELTLGQLKEILFNTLGQDLIKEGFVFAKSYFEFKKKIGKNKVKVCFDFYDYKPDWVEFNYRFEFSIDEIDREAKKLHDFCGIRYNGYSITLTEGDFHPLTKDKELKYRIDYTHKIYDFERDKAELEYSRKKLHEEFLSRLPVYTNLALFQDAFLNDYELMGTNKAPFMYVLIAAKLKGIKELEKLVPYAWEKLGLEAKPDNNNTKQLISKLIPLSLLTK